MATKFTISSIFQAIDKITGPTKQMKKSVTGFSKSAQRGFGGMNSGLRNMKRMIIGVAIALTTGAIGKALNDFAKKGDEIAKTSRQIGITVEALQELQFAAERQGISTEDFTKSMQKMNKNVGEARAGTGALTTLLNKTNPALLEQLKLVNNSEEAFNLLMQEIEGQTNQMDKAAIANAAFGRSGKNMLILAEGGTDAIAALREEARKYGGILSEIAAKNSEEFVDSMTDLKASLWGVKIMIMEKLLPVITPIINKMTAWWAANKEIVKQKFEEWIIKLKEGFRKLIPKLREAWEKFKEIWPFLKKWGPIILGIVIAVKALSVAQLALNLAMNANPIILMAGAIASLIFQIIEFRKLLPDVKKDIAKHGFADYLKRDAEAWLRNPMGMGNIFRIKGDISAPVTKEEREAQQNTALEEALKAFQRAESHVTVDINIPTAPPGTTASARTKGGGAPPINVPLGPAGLSGVRW